MFVAKQHSYFFSCLSCSTIVQGSATIFSEQVANSIKKNEHLKSLTLVSFSD